ncbi:MAG TPA: ABC transporter ATP-binding protein, partial [Phototrophicaceae bacterium]|jgi:ABC-2 type transport system ATP-binding protein|nr:ABC transporter ATP-binding protein [Phototrophicaceae bacterium]
MRMLTGFTPPTSGQAIVAGFDVFEKSMEVRKRVGYLPESVPLYRDMTALDYLMYIGEIRGVKNRKDRSKDVLKRVGLAHRANSLIRTLSKGMKQRVGLAQALIHDPEVVILDEPTIGLDPIQVLELRDLISDLRQNHTVLFSTHILSEAEQVCDRVIIIKQGEIVGQGTPGELREELERGGRVLVRVDAPSDQVIASLEQVPSVSHVITTTEGIVCTPRSASIDPRPEIARAVISSNWNLIELRPLAVNLEEIFIELTRQQVNEQETADTESVVG